MRCLLNVNRKWAMRYIDKHPFLQEGHKITDDYLESTCLIKDVGIHYHYQNVDYGGTFADTGAKQKMQDLALISQDHKCCYCMRDLSPQNQQVTLEHIIPQSASEAEFNGYTSKNVPYLTNQDIIRTGNFVGKPDIPICPRPHTVAFENLVASCDGTFPDKVGYPHCCNLHRGNKTIYPMFFASNIDKEITFTQDGSMHPVPHCTLLKEYSQTIFSLGLNCKTLKDIRRLWHLFKNVPYNILLNCLYDKSLRDKTLKEVLYQNENFLEQDAYIHVKFLKDDYWGTFLLYKWFHQKL